MSKVGPVAPSRPATRWPKSLSSQTPGAMPPTFMTSRRSGVSARRIAPRHPECVNLPWKMGATPFLAAGGRPSRRVGPTTEPWRAALPKAIADVAKTPPKTRIARTCFDLTDTYGRAQIPPLQIPDAHTLPQLPQLFESDCMSAQYLLVPDPQT